MEIRRLIITAFCLALTSTAAYSMHHGEAVADKASGFYVGADAGVALVAGGSDPFVGRASLGYSEGMFSVEAAYFESANTWGSGIWAYSRGGDLSLLLRPFTHSVLKHLYVRAGGQYSRLSAGGTGYVTTSWKGVGWLAGTGFEVPINDHISIHAGYIHYGAVGGLKDANTDAVMGGLRFNF
jgi:opacity protein-like surface antigen